MLFFAVFTALLIFKFKIITLHVAASFDRDGNAKAIQLLQKCKKITVALACISSLRPHSHLLLFYLHPALPSPFFSHVFPTRILYTLVISSIGATCPAYLISLI
jgi:hypothetical protein